MARLSELMGRVLPHDPEILGLTADSRAVQAGWLFAALPGSKADGRGFIADAVEKGAAAVLAPVGTPAPEGAVLVEDENPRRRFALMAAAFHAGQPSVMAAVTGTNGKTSTASFARQIWTKLDWRAASLGTLGVQAPGWQTYGGLTTPDPVALHAVLARLSREGVSHACMEASSHGLDQFRLDGVRLAAGAFTNLTRDHLDYHGSMEAYGAAKKRLFAELVVSGGAAVINADDPFGAELAEIARARRLRVLTYGRAGEALRLVDAKPHAQGQMVEVVVQGRPYRFDMPLAGAFQAMNALCALGLVLACGADADEAVYILSELDGVPGRLQKVAVRGNGAAVYVDYAHTPDALETVLTALRPHATGRLVVVFGCGGDRDPGKRPQMGRIAAELADVAIVTDDNPRSEVPAEIRRQILGNCTGATEIGDRAEAIRRAVAGLGEGDVLVLAGKGHERGQTVGDRVLPFDDAEEARDAVAAADGGAP